MIFKPKKCTTENYRLLLKDINKQKVNKILAITIQNPIKNNTTAGLPGSPVVKAFQCGVCGFDPWFEIYQYDSYLPHGQNKPKHKTKEIL